MTGPAADIVIDVQDLVVHFTLPRSAPFAPASKVHAVDGVSFQVRRGTTFGLVGESGSGKTTTALAMMRLAPVTAGHVWLNGTDMVPLEGEALRRARRHVQIIFQDPYSSLNPRQRVGQIVRAPLDLLDIGTSHERDAARRRTVPPGRLAAGAAGAVPAPVFRRPAPAHRHCPGACNPAGRDCLR